MTRTTMTLTFASALLMVGAHSAAAETLFEVENARGNARAGGPVSDHDAEILNRWGALSGTPRRWRRASGPIYVYVDEGAPRRLRRHHQRRIYRD